eukprot:PhM_4_TR3467/c1_g1_i1/m.60137/K14652/ribBA; 3,4-dihydroxy 2-butanone 4-phosphate synthase / GTP cyclohydrolase II
MVFGGLIRYRGELTRATPHKFFLRGLPSDFVPGVQIGDSIAINGVCLTVVTNVDGVLEFDVSDETCNKTTLGLDPTPSCVHVERALAFGDAIGGHIISGHVHNVGTITRLDRDGTMIVHLPSDKFPSRPVFKDSITIDGVSLTIAEVLASEESIRIALIPHTLDVTLFRTYKLPAPVNVELHMTTTVTAWAPPQSKIATEPRTDFEWMLEAIKEGEKGRYTAAPNPWVGAVLVGPNGTRLGAGHHVRPGGSHAERQVDYEGSWEKCVLYVTLEPCCHHGRTPPCVEFLKSKGVSRVVVGTLDPDHRVKGKGVAELREAGLDVVVGVAREQVEYSLRAYLWHRIHNRPYVVAKLALSQDNCYAYVTDTHDKREWITGDHARCHGHGIRAESQKIVVGRITHEMDKPKLDVRYGYQIDKQPEAIVSTRSLTWLRDGDQSTLQVLVEGGPELHNDLLQKRLINEFVLYRSTKHLGLKGIRWMPSFLDRDWKLVETVTFDDGDTMQRFVHMNPAADVPRLERRALKANADDVLQDEAEADPDRELQYNTIDEAVKALREGGLIVVMDDAGRENEGDLMMLADKVTLRNMKVLLANTTGIVCACMSEGRAKQLCLPLMVSHDDNSDKHRTKFTVSVDALKGVTTGVSAADRTRTLQLLADCSAKASDFARPGHIFPLIAAPGGLLERRGHTECGVELARMCGMDVPVMVISELYDHATGRMMTARQCGQLGLPIIHVEAIKQACVQNNSKSLWCDLPLQRHGDNWRLTVVNGTKILHKRGPDTPLITTGAKRQLLVRIHSECFTGDVLGSALCDCGNQLETALKLMGEDSRDGVILFPPEHEGRGIGLAEKIKAYALQRGACHLDTFEANRSLGHPDDARTYTSAVFALRYVGFSPDKWLLKLLTENPTKMRALKDGGFTVEMEKFEMDSTPYNRSYLEVKRRHFSTQQAAVAPPAEDLPLRKLAPKAWVVSAEEKTLLSQSTVCIVQAEWHRHMSDVMVDFMVKELQETYGVTHIEREFAPGSFELPRMVHHLSRSHDKHTVYVAVGVLVKGDTDHYDIVATETSRNLASIQITHDLWVVNAVLACHTMKQVEERCNPDSDKCVAPHMAHAAARLALTSYR